MRARCGVALAVAAAIATLAAAQNIIFVSSGGNDSVNDSSANGSLVDATPLVELQAAALKGAAVVREGPDTITVGGTTLLALPPLTLPAPPGVQPDEFVTRQGRRLMLKGKPFYFVGTNAYWWIDAASWGRAWGRRQVAETMMAAKRLGMRVGRTWAFNTELPSGRDTYSEEQFQALDYIIYAARVHDLKLILALGNFWNAYKSPEQFIWYAMGPQGKSIIDFYQNPAVRQVYQSHIRAMLTRVNTFTGLQYRDDPTIMGWDVLNEPRCPACDSPELQNVVVNWMQTMTDYTQELAPKQMAALGTEGFFMGIDGRGLNLANPGPGAQCEGENWPRIGGLPAVDFHTLHVYERHMEWQPVQPDGRGYDDPDWLFCGFNCYINWFVRYIQVHLEVAESVSDSKPVILEEFGLTWWNEDVRDRKVLFAVIGRLLANSAASGGSLAGIMLWNGAHNDSADQDGYNVFIDRWPRGLPSSPPGLKQLPPIMPYLASWLAAGPTVTASGRKLQGHEPDETSPDLPEEADNVPHVPGDAHGDHVTGGTHGDHVTGVAHEDHVTGGAHEDHVTGGEVHEKVEEVMGGAGRQLKFQTDKLDGFRRGWDRGSCAHESSRLWRPPLAWTNSTRSESGAAGLTDETRRWKAIEDLQVWRIWAWPLQEVDLLKWTADQVNR